MTRAHNEEVRGKKGNWSQRQGLDHCMILSIWGNNPKTMENFIEGERSDQIWVLQRFF